MIRCLAIDDEPLALRQLANFISKVPYLHLVKACPSALEAKEVLSSEMVDAVFCDINMPDLNGMDFIKGLSFPPLVVFTTAYSEYAIDGFKVDAVDYLLKPFGLDDFRRAAEKLRRRFGEQETGSTLSDNVNTSTGAASSLTAVQTEENALQKIGESTDSLFVKVENRMIKIRLSEIIYIEGMSEYLKIHLDGKDEVKVLKIKQLENEFLDKMFEER